MEANEKILAKIKQLFANAESEEKLGNSGAGILFAKKAHELLEKYKLENPLLTPDEVRIGTSIINYPFYRVNAVKKERIIWFENLGKVVGKYNFCEVEIPDWIPDDDYYGRKRSNASSRIGTQVFFSGTDLDRQIAIYILESLAKIGFNSCKFQMAEAKKNVGKEVFDFRNPNKKVERISVWPGDDVFVEKFMQGYVEAISNSFTEKKLITSTYEPVVDLGDTVEYFSLTPDERLIFALGRKTAEIAQTRIVEKSSIEIKEKVETEIANHKGDIYFLLDASGSMSGSYPKDKFEQAKDGAMESAKNLIAAGFCVGLIQFESKAELIINPVNEFTRFESAIKKLQIGGSTNMAEAIQTAMFNFKNLRAVRKICIVTDGWPDSRDKALDLAKQAKQDGIEIMAIGTEDADHNFLEELCSKPRLALKAKTEELESGMKEMTNLLVA